MGEYFNLNSCLLSDAVQLTMMLITMIMLIMMTMLTMLIIPKISVITLNNYQAAWASYLTLSS